MRYLKPNPHAPHVAEFIDATAKLTGIPRETITGPRRFKPITNARKIVYFLARKYGYSFPLIATRLGLGDHSSVVIGRVAAINMMERDRAFAALVGRVEVQAVILAGQRRERIAASVPVELREAA